MVGLLTFCKTWWDNTERRLSWSSRKGTLAGCINAAGDSLIPLIIQTNKTVNQEIYKYGLREGEDVKILYSTNGYIATELFNELMNEIFIPYVNNVRSCLGLSSETAVLATDNGPLYWR